VEGGGRPPVVVAAAAVVVVGGPPVEEEGPVVVVVGATTTTCFFEDGNSNRRPTTGVGETYPTTKGVPGGKFGFVHLLLEEGKSFEIEIGGGPTPTPTDAATADDAAPIIPVVPSSLLVLLLLRVVDVFLVADSHCRLVINSKRVIVNRRFLLYYSYCIDTGYVIQKIVRYAIFFEAQN